MKILILKPSSLGDVVQAIPVLRLLKRRFPSSEIHWWLSTELLPLLEGDPDLAGIVPFERRRWASPRTWKALLNSIHWMRRQKFDLVIDLQSLARSGAIAWLAGGKLTIGIDDPREGAAAFYDLRVPRPSHLTHAVDWYLEVLRSLDVPVHLDFPWLPEDRDVQARIRAQLSNRSRPLVAINPGGRWTNKRWPAARFAETVRQLASRNRDTTFVILGGRDDVELASEIHHAAPDRCLNVAGRTTLREMIEWLRAADLLITNDTGPMHVAAAAGTPVLALFGPTEPRRTGPYRQVNTRFAVRTECAPCLSSRCSHVRFAECLNLISVDEVVEAALAHVERRPASPTDRISAVRAQ